MDIIYKDCERIELNGEYKGFNWNLNNLGSGKDYITLKLCYIDNIWEIAKEIPKNYILNHLEKGNLNKFLKGIFDEIIDSKEKAIGNKQNSA